MAGKTLSEQIYDELYHDITRQQLRCGQKLTLNMLKERFHVSHTPIREALMRLAENGLVTYYSNCGVTVIEFEERDIQELYQFASEMDALAIQFCSASLNQMPLVLDLQEIIETAMPPWRRAIYPSGRNFQSAFMSSSTVMRRTTIWIRPLLVCAPDLSCCHACTTKRKT